MYTLWESPIRTLLVLREFGLGSPRVYNFEWTILSKIHSHKLSEFSNFLYEVRTLSYQIGSVYKTVLLNGLGTSAQRGIQKFNLSIHTFMSIITNNLVKKQFFKPRDRIIFPWAGELPRFFSRIKFFKIAVFGGFIGILTEIKAILYNSKLT